jgi:hypothetical protein
MRPAQDLLHLLARDHRRLDERCRSLLADEERRSERAVVGLATDVLVHEAAEQLLLHPLVAERSTSGERYARQRIDEEEGLERRLQAALREDPTGARFVAPFRAFHRAFVEHTDREELEVFPSLRHVVDRRELRELGRTYATLAVRLPTRLRCELGGHGMFAEPERRPLACIRETAQGILAELAQASTGTATRVAHAAAAAARRQGNVGGGAELAGSA